MEPTFASRCWICGKALKVPIDRRDRGQMADTAGVNTVVPDVRLCLRCDGAIKRASVAEMDRLMRGE